ncbi:MAG: BACON domain-containing protein, partial [Firmicutes bacterium]|nr:BACON domain-containing protein [Bacillota bacterium]
AGTFPPVTAINVTYTPGLTLAGVNLPAGYTWNTPSTALNVPGGSYQATYRAANYTDAAGSVTVTVTAAAGDFGSPGPLSALYTPGLTLASVALPTGYTWNTPATALSIPGGSYPATRSQGANYTQTTGNITVNVAAAAGTFPMLSPITVAYTPGMTLAGVTLPAGYTWNTPATALSVPGGSYQATYRAANYTDAIGSVTVNVTAATGTFPTVSAINVVYTPGLTLAGVTLPAGCTWNAPTTALSVPGGSYQATYRAANYADATGNVTVNVLAATGSFPAVSAITVTYTPGLTLANVALPAGYIWNAPATALGVPGGSYPATYKATNYTDAAGSVAVNVTLSSLELSVSDWNPGAAASSTMITVTSNVAWTVSNSVSWLTVSPAGGTNNGSFTVYAATNAGMAPRGGTITVSGGGVSQTVTVAQDGAAASLTLSPSAWNPGPEASSAAISIRANVAWIVSSPAWLTTSLSGGMNDWSLTIYAEANTGTASRSGTVTVTGGGISRTVTVTQAGKPTARFDEHEVYIPYRKVSAIYFTGDAYYAVSGDTSIVTAHLSAGYGRPAAVLESQRRPWKFTKGESTTVFLLDENQQEIDRCRVHVTTSFWEWLIVILLFGWIWY